jgi:hypothetical protein
MIQLPPKDPSSGHCFIGDMLSTHELLGDTDDPNHDIPEMDFFLFFAGLGSRDVVCFPKNNCTIHNRPL